MKTLNGQRVCRISLVSEEKVCGGKDLPKSQVLSSEWKIEQVREDESGDSEDGEDELPCVIEGEFEGDCVLSNVSVCTPCIWNTLLCVLFVFTIFVSQQ